MSRWKRVLCPDLKKGPWQEHEDRIIKECQANGTTKWADISRVIPGRTGKQCRERWNNHLNPDLRKGVFDEEEDLQLMRLHNKLGNKWSAISKLMPTRSENCLKNRWNSLDFQSRFNELQTILKMEQDTVCTTGVSAEMPKIHEDQNQTIVVPSANNQDKKIPAFHALEGNVNFESYQNPTMPGPRRNNDTFQPVGSSAEAVQPINLLGHLSSKLHKSTLEQQPNMNQDEISWHLPKTKKRKDEPSVVVCENLQPHDTPEFPCTCDSELLDIPLPNNALTTTAQKQHHHKLPEQSSQMVFTQVRAPEYKGKCRVFSPTENEIVSVLEDYACLHQNRAAASFQHPEYFHKPCLPPAPSPSPRNASCAKNFPVPSPFDVDANLFTRDFSSNTYVAACSESEHVDLSGINQNDELEQIKAVLEPSHPKMW